jgi:hypothetical protein
MEPYLVTGDNERVARAVANAVGIAEVRAGVLPDGKADIVRQLQADGTRVAMVGDGINDAPALMQADVGVAIGAGTDIAIDSADVILIGERVSAVADAYDIATESYRKTKQNLTIALALNSIGVPAATSGYLNPIWAMVAMVTSVTIVLSNSFGTNLPLTLWKGIKTVLLPELFSQQQDAEAAGVEPASAPAVANQVTEEQTAASPATVTETLESWGLPAEPVLSAPLGKEAPAGGEPGSPPAGQPSERRPALTMAFDTAAPAPWFEEPGPQEAPGCWARWRAWIWTAVIVVAVMGLGAWNVIANGPVHPHG